MVRVPIASMCGSLVRSEMRCSLMRSRIASERFVYPFFLMMLSKWTRSSGSMETPKRVMFSMGNTTTR